MAAIIFETVAKLTSLTSTSVFLLIESDGCRRFSGSPQLRDAYLHGALAATPTDKQINVDLNLRVTEEVDIASLRPPAFPNPGVFDPTFHPTRSSSYSSPVPSSSPVVDSRKRNSATSGIPPPAPGPSSSKKVKASMEVEVKDEVTDQKPDVATLPSNEGGKEVATIDDNSDVDSDIEVLDSFFDESSYTGSDGGGGGGGGGGGNGSVSDIFNVGDTLGSHANNASFLPGDASTSLIANIPCNQKKVDALRSIQDPMRAFQKVGYGGI